MNGGGGGSGGGYSCCCCVIGFVSSLNFMMERSSNISISTKFMFSTRNEIIMGLMFFKLQAKTNAMAELTMGMDDKTQQQYNSSHFCIPNSWCLQRSLDQISEWELEGGNANGRQDDAGLRFSLLLQLNLFSDQQA
jgi:hypothetical protein